MKRQIVVTNQFRKDYKQVMKRGLKIDLLDDVIRLLSEGNQRCASNVSLK